MNCPYCESKIIDGELICHSCKQFVVDFDYLENMDKMSKKYSKSTLLELSKEKLTFEEIITIHTYIERADHHGGDGEVSDKCQKDGTFLNLSKRLEEIK